MRNTLDIKEFCTMREDLRAIARKEAMNLWRLARRAINHRVSIETIHDIRREADILYNEMTSYPERLLDWTRTWNYAFSGHSLYRQ